MRHRKYVVPSLTKLQGSGRVQSTQEWHFARVGRRFVRFRHHIQLPYIEDNLQTERGDGSGFLERYRHRYQG